MRLGDDRGDEAVTGAEVVVEHAVARADRGADVAQGAVGEPVQRHLVHDPFEQVSARIVAHGAEGIGGVRPGCGQALALVYQMVHTVGEGREVVNLGSSAACSRVSSVVLFGGSCGSV